MAKYVGVTACPTGIAHTYMAAEKLEEAARERGDSIKVETQGSIGAENVLTSAEIAEADGVIIAADTEVDPSRFVGKRTVMVGVNEGIDHPEKLMTDVLSAPEFRGAQEQGESAGHDSSQGKESAGRFIYRALMNGVSHMIPFVVVGGIFIALALGIGGEASEGGAIVVAEDSIWMSVQQLGALAFSLMVPVLAGFIAQAIADRPGLVVGMVSGFIANNGVMFPFLTVTGADGEPTGLDTGFIGAIAIGFLAGFVAKWIRQIPWHDYIKPVVPILIIPIVGTAVVGLLYIYVLGRPLAALFNGMTDWLASMSGTSTILLALIVGAMIAFDMGGPVNKVAFLFAGGMIATDGGAIMGMAAAAIAVPPLGMGLATLIRRRVFTVQERESGIAALFMGFFGITEGAIPFAAADPARIIPANVIGGSVAAVLAGIFGVHDVVMHGGPIVGVLGAATPLLLFFLAIAVGAVVTAVLATVLKSLGGRSVMVKEAQPAVRA